MHFVQHSYMSAVRYSFKWYYLGLLGPGVFDRIHSTYSY